MHLPPQSLHWFLRLPCSQRPLPPQSLHKLLTFPCWQAPLPPQSLQRCFVLPCRQMLTTLQLLPLLGTCLSGTIPQSLQRCFVLPCRQMLTTLQLLHLHGDQKRKNWSGSFRMVVCRFLSSHPILTKSLYASNNGNISSNTVLTLCLAGDSDRGYRSFVCPS
jgi:hypothetical protein